MKRILAKTLSRRHLFAGGAASAIAAITGTAQARVAAGSSSDFVYEINHSDEEWRAMLGDDDFAILREGFTEKPKSSPLWLEVKPGMYNCKGCDLPVYDGQWKVILEPSRKPIAAAAAAIWATTSMSAPIWYIASTARPSTSCRRPRKTAPPALKPTGNHAAPAPY